MTLRKVQSLEAYRPSLTCCKSHHCPNRCGGTPCLPRPTIWRWLQGLAQRASDSQWMTRMVMRIALRRHKPRTHHPLGPCDTPSKCTTERLYVVCLTKCGNTSSANNSVPSGPGASKKLTDRRVVPCAMIDISQTPTTAA